MRRRNGRPGLTGTMARTAVIAGTATAVSGSVANKRQVRAGQEAELADEEFTAMKAKLLGL